MGLTTDVLVLHNQSPAPENLSLRLTPVWEPEGTTAYAGTPAFIVGGASSLGQYGKPPTSHLLLTHLPLHSTNSALQIHPARM